MIGNRGVVDRSALLLGLVLVWGLTVPTAALGAAREPRGPGAPRACSVGWAVKAAPNGAGESSALGSVAVVNARDIWAAGTTGDLQVGAGTVHNTLLEHWDGSAWTVTPSPNGVNPTNYLIDTAAVASGDVWAVGYSTDNEVSKTLTLHWNGSSWSRIPSPNPQPDFGTGYEVENELYGVAAFASDDVWAVGQSIDNYGTFSQTLILHWNGSRWRPVAAPHSGRYSDYRAISGTSAGDIWAVGNRDRNGLQVSLTAHYDGTGWTRVASPNVGSYLNTFFGVSATSPSDVWAFGFHQALFGASEPYQTSALHWDGSTWSVVSTPNASQEPNYLYTGVGLSANDAWAVGFYDTGQFTIHTLIEHWDGVSWTIVASPNAGDSVINELTDVAAITQGALVAVGQSFGFESYNTLALRYRSTCPASSLG
jgi:hypothetical protein